MKGLTGLLCACALLVCGLGTPLKAQTASAPASFPSDIPGLLNMGSLNLSKGPGGAADMKALAYYVGQKYQADKAAGGLKWNDWIPLARMMAPYLDDATKGAMCQDLVAALAPTKDAIAALDRAKMCWIAGSLQALGRSAMASSIAGAWLAGSDQSKSMSADAVISVAGLIQDSKETAAKAKVIDLVAQNFLADSASVKKLSPHQWLILSWAFSKDIPANTKQLWISKVRQAYFASDGTMSGLSRQDSSDIVRFLRAMGDSKAGDAMGSWVKSGDDWKAMSPGDLLNMVSGDAADSATGKATRTAVGEYLTSKYLSAPDAAKSLTASFWLPATTLLGKDLSADNRALWVKKLDSLLPADPKQMKSSDVQAYSQAYKALGEPARAQSVISAFVGSPKDLTPGDLCTLVAAVSKGQDAASKSTRAKLIDALNSKVFSDAGSLKAVGLGNAIGITLALADDLTDQTRAAWATKARGAFADATGMASLTEKDEAGLSIMLHALRYSDMPAFNAMLINQGTTWQSWSPAAVVTMAGIVDNSKADGCAAARATLIQYVGSKYMADAASVRTVSTRLWRDLGGCMGPHLDAKTKASWANSVKAGYAGDASQIVKLKSSQAADLVQFLSSMGDSGASSVAAAWANSPDALNSASFTEVQALLSAMAMNRNASRQAIAQVADHIATKFLPEAGTNAGVMRDWFGVVYNVNSALSPDARKVWIDALRQAWHANLPKLLDNPVNATGLQGALGLLGDSDTGRIVTELVNAGDSWQKWQTGDLSWLLSNVGRDQSPDSKSARTKLVAYVSTRMKSDAKFANAMNASNWSAIVADIRDQAGASRSATADQMMQMRAPNDQALLALAPKDFKSLVETMVSLDKSRVPALLGKYFSDPSKQSVAIGELGAMLGRLAKSDKQMVADVLPQLDQAWLAKDAAQGLTFADCKGAFRAWFYVDRAKTQVWAMKVYEKGVGSDTARTSADLNTLTSISWVMDWSGLMSQDNDWSQYLATMISLARQGKLEGIPYDYNMLSRLLVKDKNRKVIEDAVVDSNGRPSLPLAKAVNWAYRNAGDLPAWQAKIDANIAGAKDTNSQAIWLLAKAHASQMDVGTPAAAKTNPGLAKPWLDKALASASDDKVRLAVLKEMVACHIAMKQPTAAVAIVASVKGQFHDELQATLDSLQREIQDDAAQQDKAETQRQQTMEKAGKRSLLEYYKHQLKIAQTANDAEKAANITDAIGKLEKDLAQ